MTIREELLAALVTGTGWSESRARETLERFADSVRGVCPVCEAPVEIPCENCISEIREDEWAARTHLG